MMQTEGNQGAVDETEEEGAEVSGLHDHIPQQEDAVLDHGPYEVEDHAHGHGSQHIDDGNKAGPAEEGQS